MTSRKGLLNRNRVQPMNEASTNKIDNSDTQGEDTQQVIKPNACDNKLFKFFVVDRFKGIFLSERV